MPSRCFCSRSILPCFHQASAASLTAQSQTCRGDAAIEISSHRNGIRWLGLLLMLAFVVGACWLAIETFSPGASSSHESENRVERVVTGRSMVPTLQGPSQLAACSNCLLQWAVTSSGGGLRRGQCRCYHCGQPVAVGLSQTIGVTAAQPSIVTIAPLVADRSLGPGVLVAIARPDASDAIKRVVALAGDVVDVDPDGFHLSVNGQRIEDALHSRALRFPVPQFTVDRDDHRSTSRWRPETSSGGWQRDSNRRWVHSGSQRSDWLVYHHLSVHDRGQPSTVYDDYPYNIDLSRRLFPVDRLSVSGQCQCAATVTIDVMFWSRRGINRQTVRMEPGLDPLIALDVAIDHQSLDTETEAPVDAMTPIAIRVAGSAVTIEALTIRRLAEYRLRPSDDRNDYPLRIGKGECFVLGDNVPVSVDSRDWGPLTVDSIQGIVTSARNR